ncbi:MAG: DsrE/DsrF/DrsH-like family protein [Lachnospiraceae bacterium]|nr:DsrE/DsrF/DrsH-like family protein [Lachnospiraceae bacterium]
MGKEVIVFFTFWGLNILTSSDKIKTKMTFLGSGEQSNMSLFI